MTHVATLRAYSFPIVIRAFQKHGLPGQIEKLAAQERGPLAVALAAELAAITTRLLVGTLRRIRLELRSELHVPQGFEEVDPRDVLDQALWEREVAFGWLKNMERGIQSLLPDEALVFMNEVGSCENRNNLVDEVARMPRSWPFRRELQALLPEYCEQSASYIAAVNRHRACRNLAPTEEMPPVGTKVKVTETEPCSEPKGAFDDLQIDFCGGSPILDRGCAARLRRHNADWWAEVTCYIQSNVRVNLENNTAKVLLRHPSVVKDILYAQNGGSEEDRGPGAPIALETLKLKAAHDFFMPSEWLGTNRVYDNFKSLLVVLKNEDTMANEWIRNNDSASPYNIYEVPKVKEFAWRKPALKKELLRRLARPPLC